MSEIHIQKTVQCIENLFYRHRSYIPKKVMDEIIDEFKWLVNQRHELIDENIKLDRRNKELKAQLKYYENAICYPGLKMMYAIKDAGAVPAIDPERVADVLKERDELRGTFV